MLTVAQANENVCKKYIQEMFYKRIQNIVDITSGSEYKKMAVEGFLDRKNPYNITVTFNTDGISLFKSTNVSLWPIYLAINELPPKERFFEEEFNYLGNLARPV